LGALSKKLEGLATSKGYAVGKIVVVRETEDCNKVVKGDIMVLIQLNPDLIPAAARAGALIGDEGGHTSHTAIVGRELNKPTIVNTKVGTSTMKDGMLVFVDSIQGIVFEVNQKQG
jgi:pyruvate, water dikinase